MHKEKGIWVFSEAEKIILMQQYADGASIIDISLSTNVNASTISYDFDLREYLLEVEMMQNE